MLGGWDQWDKGQGVAIGQRLAEKLGRHASAIPSPSSIRTGPTRPSAARRNIRSYPVSVIFNLGMVEFDSFYVYMPMQAAQKYFKLYEDVLKPGVQPPAPDATDEQINAAYQRNYQATAVEVFIDDPDNVAAVRQRIQEQVERPLILYDWQQRNETFFSALQVERVVMFVILSMIIVVAAFNIISSLVMLVKDKGSDIAILRTMGATRGSIMRIFSMTGTAIGVAGTLARADPRAGDRGQRRGAAGIHLQPHERADLSAGGVLPLEPAVEDRPDRSHRRRRPRARPQLPRDALSRLARRAVRPGRGAAI